MSFPKVPPKTHCRGLLLSPSSPTLEAQLFHSCLLSPTKWLPLCHLLRTPGLATQDCRSPSIEEEPMPRKSGVEASSEPWARIPEMPESHLREQPRQCGHVPPDPNPAAKLGNRLEEGASPNTAPSAPSPNAAASVAKKAPLSRWKQYTEETMDVSGPAQEQETSSRKGTGARDELMEQTSTRWDAETEVRRFEHRKPTRTGTLPLPLAGGRRKGGSGGLSFVSRREALDKG